MRMMSFQATLLQYLCKDNQYPNTIIPWCKNILGFCKYEFNKTKTDLPLLILNQQQHCLNTHFFWRIVYDPSQ